MWHGRKRLLEVELETHPAAVVLRLHGSAGITEAEALRVALESLIQQGTARIVVDLSDVHYVASIAASAVAAGICRANAAGDRVRLAAPSAGVRDVLSRSRISECLRIYPSVAAAMGSGLSSHGPAGPAQGRGRSAAREAEHTRLSVRIPVAFGVQERVAHVPVSKGRGNVLKRLVARILGWLATDGPMPEVA
jgi:anti-anti-sigma factor